MLKLDDKRWQQFKDASGNASKIPDLLNKIMSDPENSSFDKEPWVTIWTNLCHQGTVYEASYAAVPYIVQALANAGKPIDFSFVLFPASVEYARLTGNGPELPNYLNTDYKDSLENLEELIGKISSYEWDLNFTRAVCFALATLKNHLEFADKLDRLFD